MKIEYTVDTNNIPKQFLARAERASTLLPLFPAAKTRMETSFASNFASNGLQVGGWAPLDAEYASWKATRFPGAPSLVRSGRLFRSVATQNRAAFRATRMEFEFGTSVPYAKFHQYGTEKMPKRQIIFTPRNFGDWFGGKAVSWVVDGEL
jgi:phage gpG-like protein